MEVAGNLLQRPSGQILPQAELTPEEVVWAEEADGQVGVGHRWFRPARSVTGRTGDRPSAYGTDPEIAYLVHPCDGTSSVPDLDDVHDGHLDGITGIEVVPLDRVVRRELHRQVLDEARLRRRAPAVEHDYVALAHQLADLGSRNNSCDRAGFDSLDRNPLHEVKRCDTSAGEHHVEDAVEFQLAKPRGEPCDVSFDEGHDVRVQ